MKYIKLFEEYIKNDWKYIDKGSEGEIYLGKDGFIYKVVNSDLVPSIKEISKHIGINYKNVVHIYDVWKDEDKVIIKMENLDKIDKTEFSDEELEDMFLKLFHIYDEVSKLPDVIKSIKNPKLKKMVEAMYNAGLELNKTILDVGLHNLMFDSKTNEYKQIDFF